MYISLKWTHQHCSQVSCVLRKITVACSSSDSSLISPISLPNPNSTPRRLSHYQSAAPARQNQRFLRSTFLFVLGSPRQPALRASMPYESRQRIPSFGKVLAISHQFVQVEHEPHSLGVSVSDCPTFCPCRLHACPLSVPPLSPPNLPRPFSGRPTLCLTPQSPAPWPCRRHVPVTRPT